MTHWEIQREDVMRTVFRAAALAIAGMWASHALAVETIGGQIDTLYVAQGNNFGYRVTIAGQSKLCSGANGNFAYTNAADDNYKAYVANLMLAYTQGKPVTLTMEVVNGYCHLLEVGVHN
jgi:hypothetical protein